MRFTAIAAACLMLAGCQTASIDTALQTNLPKVCSGARIAHLAFRASTGFVTVSATTQRREQTAWAVLEPLCVDPAGATTGDVLVAAIGAYGTIAAALREAERADD